ncbi:YlbL family protein [Ornithinimicrobium avium]|uniref:PDZ domain-containing protein n=1 Tax=Ornithinimicrobium avium TaxID=2283195 RepID=A0A345NRK5_9MICO|nr:PDZ domain-containing protein [Ornithinimicrobium avium]AXH97663.1 PDZ domain-containing protein [Ornithinimicrobium avium]
MSDGHHEGDTDPTTAPPHTGVGLRSGVALILVAVLMLAGAALSWIPVDKVIFRPGPVFNTLGTIDGSPIISVEDDLRTYPTGGDLYFTTVILDGSPGTKVTAWEWLTARFDPALSVYQRQDVFPSDVTAQQVREQNTELMEHSQEDAAVVGLRAAGITVPEEIVVAQVIADAPADGVLHVDDQILSVEGERPTDTETVRETLQDVQPGDSAAITVLRGGKKVDLEVPTKRDEQTGRTIVGVYLAPRYEMPYTVTIDAGNVGGPSAGLMFSLAVYDTITEGELTGGHAFAGTGTISGQGIVGPISGIPQKMYASERAGAELFLAPVDNCDEVAGAEPDGLTVVPVATFEEALGFVEQAAATDDVAALDLPTCEQVLDDGATSTDG